VSKRSFCPLDYPRPQAPFSSRQQAPNPAHRRFAVLCAAFLLAGSAFAGPARAQKFASPILHIAAAADLQPVLPTLAAAYKQATGVEVVASFGSSATLTQQLSSGAPQDLFLSADFVHPEQLVAARLTTETAPVPYARGVLVLWARKDSPAQPLSLDSLTKASVTRVAVANDGHAPYGAAATAALRSLGFTQAVSPKLVVAENIAQTAQFAESGNAQAALISLTLASSPQLRATGTFIRFATATYPPIRQCAVILKSSPNIPAAEAFLHWLTSPAVQAQLPSLGLDPVQ
jgi:molybdate transport system substrate-binding protein